MKIYVSGYKNLVNEWSPLNDKSPSEVTHGSTYRASWVCSKCSFSWEARVDHRVGRGSGCPKCSTIVASKKRRVPKSGNSVAEACPVLVDLWSDKNDLGPESYNKGSKSKVWFKCKNGNHSDWLASIDNVSRGRRCPLCKGLRISESLSKPKSENSLAEVYPNLASEWHIDNDKNPDEVNKCAKYRAKWICSNGHEWVASVSDRAYGYGCPKCVHRVSTGELEIQEFLSSIGVKFNASDRSLGFEVDILIPTHSIAVEYNGLYWHSEKFRNKNSHAEKWRKCEEKGIQLITVWEDDWLYRKPLVKSLLSHKLGKDNSKKVFARNLEVSKINYKESFKFLTDNHLQGSSKGSAYLALKDGDEVVAVMVLSNARGSWTLQRYATSCRVIGGHSKLLSYFKRNYEYSSITTFADLCVSNGNLYEKTGWTFDSKIPPDYKYVIGNKRSHKFNYRKIRFKEDENLIYDDNLTETELAKLNKLYRIWDCGKLKYTMT